MKDVGYPTIFSASETTLVQFEGAELENRLSVLCPRLDKALWDNRVHVAGSIFCLTALSLVCLLQVPFNYLPPSLNRAVTFDR